MDIQLNLLLITMVIYSGLLILLIIGNIFSDKKNTVSEFPPVSVIVAIRNGENALQDLIGDLEIQHYKGDLEFILVDDRSEDATAYIIQEISKKDKRFIYESSINGNASLQMKKRALDAGISRARHEWLLFTDVDCRVPNSWVRGMAGYFSNDIDYVIGYSHVESGSSLVTLFQSVDYFLLLTATRGFTNLSYALACTGQNQAYRKSLYHQVDGFLKIKNQLQGDDSLFLNVCKKYEDINIIYADDSHGHILARQEKKWVSLFMQRLRWSGDANIMWKFNRSFYLLMLGFFLFHLMIISLFFFSIQNPHYFPVLVKFLTIKFVLEFFLNKG